MHVNRQIYSEALPIFFAVNRFECADLDDLGTLAGMLRKSSSISVPARKPLCANEPYRFQHVGHLSISYNRFGGLQDHEVQHAFDELLSIRKLNRLTVEIYDDYWFKTSAVARHYATHLRRVYDHPRELPRIAELVQLVDRAESYELLGSEGVIRYHVESEVRMLREWKTNEFLIGWHRRGSLGPQY